MVPEAEAAIALENLRRLLFLMKSEVRQMVADKDDRVLKLEVVRGFDDRTLEMLKTVLGKLEQLSKQADEANGGKVFALSVEEICSCSIHREHMKKTSLEISKGAPIMTLSSFLFPKEPVALLRALVTAEKEAVNAGLMRQPQLFTSMLAKINYWVRTKNVLESNKTNKSQS